MIVALEDIQIQLCGISGFNPEESCGSAIIVVPDVGAGYHAFAGGLRKAYGKLLGGRGFSASSVLGEIRHSHGNKCRRYPDAPAVVIARVMFHRTELAVLLGDAKLARALLSPVVALKLRKAEKEENAAKG